MEDVKFIIVKDKQNKLRHYKSDIYDHYHIAKLNGYDVKELLETGMIIDKTFYILECYNDNHRKKITENKKFIANDVNKYLEELTNYRILKAREMESRYMYDKNSVGLKEGD